MFKVLSSALLLGCMASAQLAPAPFPAAAPNGAESAKEVPPDAPVITLDGFCPDSPAAAGAKSPGCKTVITRAQFEKLIDTLNPKMPPQARQSVATDYARTLVLSNEAKKRGIEDTQRYKDLLNFVKMRLAAQELLQQIQEQSKPTDAEVEAYYKDNPSKYEEISLKKVFIPRNSPMTKPTDPKMTDDVLRAEAEKIRARLAAGEDFDKVQKEIYTEKGYKSPPPPTTIPNWRRESVPPAQASLFNLKEGELSQVMIEPAGAYIYKVDKKQTTPLETVKSEIQAQLGGQKMRESMESLTASIKPQLNEAYFRGMMPAMRPGMVGPANAAPHMTVAPAPASQRTTARTPPQKPSAPKP